VIHHTTMSFQQQAVYRPSRQRTPVSLPNPEEANAFGWGGEYSQKETLRTTKPAEQRQVPFMDDFGWGGNHASNAFATQKVPVYREQSYVSRREGPPRSDYAAAVDMPRPTPERAHPFVPSTRKPALEDFFWNPPSEPQNSTQLRAQQGELPLLGHWMVRRRQEDSYPLQGYDPKYDRGSVVGGRAESIPSPNGRKLGTMRSDGAFCARPQI
jgi:hypothetical protein